MKSYATVTPLVGRAFGGGHQDCVLGLASNGDGCRGQHIRPFQILARCHCAQPRVVDLPKIVQVNGFGQMTLSRNTGTRDL